MTLWRARRLLVDTGVRLGAAALLLAVAGCRTNERAGEVPVGPVFSPSNYVSARALPPDFQRVAVLPFYYEGPEVEWIGDLETVFHGELARSGRFELLPIRSSVLVEWTGRASLASFEPLSPSLFETLRREYAVDGILFTDLSRYSPYRPLAIGLRSKLVTADGSMLWAIDEVFDAGQVEVSRGARSFYLSQIRQPYPLDSSRSVLQSPGRFGKYVAYMIYQTLPSQ